MCMTIEAAEAILSDSPIPNLLIVMNSWAIFIPLVEIPCASFPNTKIDFLGKLKSVISVPF